MEHRHATTQPGRRRAPRYMLLAGVLVLALLALTFGVIACGSGDEVGDGGTVSTTEGSETTVTVPPEESTTTSTSEASETTTTTTSAPEDETMKVRVYYSRDEKISRPRPSAAQDRRRGRGGHEGAPGRPHRSGEGSRCGEQHP